MRARSRAPLVVAAGLVLAPAQANAASGTTVESGWWNEAAVGSLTTPSATPAGQLQVSNGFSGPLAFAAVRINLPTGTPPASQVTLRLAVPSGSTVGTPAVSACPTTSNWKPGPDQSASAAPGYSCRSGRQADGVAQTGAESWTFPASWGTGGAVSVALVPTPGTTQPFSISYTAPTADSVSIGPPTPQALPPVSTAAPAPSSGEPTATSPGASGQPVGTGGGQSPAGATAVVAPGGALSPAGAGQAPALGAIPGGATASSAGGGPAATGPAAGATGTGGSSGGSAGGAVAAPASAAPGGGIRPAGDRTGRGGRIMAFCLLVATGLALWFVAAQPDRAPRLLGSLRARRPGGEIGTGAGALAVATTAPPVIRGLGRFARERTGPPKRL